MKETKQQWIRLICLILVVTLFSTSVAGAAGNSGILTVGSKGTRVRDVKRRLRLYRCLGNDLVNVTYSEKTEEAVKLFQRLNGLPETGEVDEETEKKLFSDEAEYAPWPTFEPLCTPAPAAEPDWPERDREGYLAGEGEYIYENEEEGQWIYLSRNLQILIRKVRDRSVPLEWFETEILTRNGESMRTVMTDPEHPSKRFRYPYDIAQKAGLVLGFSDDFYADRANDKKTVGIIIREGQILYSKTNKNTSHYLPNLDMMAHYPDGRLEVYECNELTAQELIERGAVNVFSFGPILIRDGEINEMLYSYYRSNEPRQVLGMIEPNHYFLLSILGRIQSSKGTLLQMAAEMMKNKGVTQALNLDGGNTLALVFNGKILNKKATYRNKTFYRTLTSMIGFGHTDYTGE